MSSSFKKSVVQESDMIVRFRGVRGSLPSPAAQNMRIGGNTSCVEIRSGDEVLVLDSGSGIRQLGEDLIGAAEGRPIEATLIFSHTHWDHIQGLPFFAPGYAAHNRIRIFGAHGYGSHLQEALTNQMSSPYFPVGLEQMRGLGRVEELSAGPTTIGGFKIRTTPLNHPGGCTGFRIEAGSSSVAFLPDHEPYDLTRGGASVRAHADLVDFVQGADVLILDTQYTADEYQRRIGWGHGCLPSSLALAIEARVGRLLLFHHDPSHNDDQIESMVDEGRRLAEDSPIIIEAASENHLVRVQSQMQSRWQPPLPRFELCQPISQ